MKNGKCHGSNPYVGGCFSFEIVPQERLFPTLAKHSAFHPQQTCFVPITTFREKQRECESIWTTAMWSTSPASGGGSRFPFNITSSGRTPRGPSQPTRAHQARLPLRSHLPRCMSKRPQLASIRASRRSITRGPGESLPASGNVRFPPITDVEGKRYFARKQTFVQPRRQCPLSINCGHSTSGC